MAHSSPRESVTPFGPVLLFCATAATMACSDSTRTSDSPGPGIGGTTTSDSASGTGGNSQVQTSSDRSRAGGAQATAGTSATAGNLAASGSSAQEGVASTAGTVATGGLPATDGSSDCSTPPIASELVGWASVPGSGVATTTGGGDMPPSVVTSLAALNSAARGTESKVIHVRGELSGAVSIGSNKTIVGICGAKITGSVQIRGSNNVIFRNIAVVGLNCSDSPSDCSSGSDAITVYASHHIWFDHIDVSDGSDGNLDITQASDFVTISWSKFSYSSARTDLVAGTSGHRFSNLVGSSDDNAGDVGKLNVTYHHNWWADHVDQRSPRVRYGKIHVLNNLYTSANNNYCIGVGMGASVRIENNAFIGVNRPVNSGSFADAATTFTAVGNLYTNTTGTVTDVGTAFVPTYPYLADAASAVQAIVQAAVGPKG